MTELTPIRRIVTTHDEDGLAIVKSDEAIPALVSYGSWCMILDQPLYIAVSLYFLPNSTPRISELNANRAFLILALGRKRWFKGYKSLDNGVCSFER